MADAEHVDLIRQGPKALEQWSTSNPYSRLALRGAKLAGLNLEGANLRWALLEEADLEGANLRGAKLAHAFLAGANLRFADLSNANLAAAQLIGADLSHAKFNGAGLRQTNLAYCTLRNTDFAGSIFMGVILASTNLSDCRGLEAIVHLAPTIVDMQTLSSAGPMSNEKVTSFLQQSGYPPWQSLVAALDGRARDTVGQIAIGGVFISYSHIDSDFATRLDQRLAGEGISVWRDKHELVAGRLERQIEKAIRLHDIVVVVLSESSMTSDWVEHELSQARQRERDEGRDILCPVALDDGWQRFAEGHQVSQVLLQQVRKYNILDFSGWRDHDQFEVQFKRLLRGLSIFYRHPTNAP